MKAHTVNMRHCVSNTNLLLNMTSTLSSISKGVDLVGEAREPVHVYSPEYEVRTGSKVNTATAIPSVLVTLTAPGTTSPSALIHMTSGMSVRPGISSDTTQVRLNSDPATRLPDILMSVEMARVGTATEREREGERYDDMVREYACIQQSCTCILYTIHMHT